MMASSKLATSSRRSRNSDLSRRPSSTKPKTATTTTPTTTPSSATAAPAAAANPQIPNLSDDNSSFNYGYGTNTTSSSLQFGSMTLDGLMGDSNSGPMTDATLLGAQITLLDNALAAAADINLPSASPPPSRTVDEVWQDIVSGRAPKQTKQEAPEMTLEDFLARAGAVEEQDIKGFTQPPPPPQTAETERLSSGRLFSYDQISTLSPFGSIEKAEGSAFGNGGEVAGSGGSGRGKRGRVVLEPLDKAAQQRQRRMIKNRESAARSRERKQAYQSELESLAVRLEEENEQLLKEQAERMEERRKQLMETVIPVVEKRRPSRALRRVHSLQW